MTTTSTFQGVDSNSKPSSRVLNPPGGGSSNIFGGYEDKSNQRTPVRNNPDNVNRGNNDIFNRDAHAAATTPSVQNPSNVNRGSNDIFNQGSHAATPQPRSRAPRSEYNPITGQMYEQPKAPQEPQASVQSGSNSINAGMAAESVDDGPAETQTSAPQHEMTAPQQERKQQGGLGIFGGGAPEEPRGHPSTRVIHPPGGRSTKLW